MSLYPGLKNGLSSTDIHHRVRDLKEEPYSQKEAEAAAGLTWTDNGKRKEDDYELEMAEAT